MSIELNQCVEHFTIDQSLLLKCFEGMTEVLNNVSISSVLLVLSHAWNKTAAKHVIEKPKEWLKDREDLEVTLVHLFKGDDGKFIICSV